MLTKVYKYIWVLTLCVIVLGHHWFQVEALETKHSTHSTHEYLPCSDNGCDHRTVDFEICEQLSDEVQIPSTHLSLPETSDYCSDHGELHDVMVVNHTVHEYQRIPIFHKQLARSQL